MEQDNRAIESPGSDFYALIDNSNDMQVDTETGIQAEPVEPKEKIEDPKPLRALMQSGDGFKILDETPSTSKSTGRLKSRNQSCMEFQRILLPRSSKTRAYESLRNILPKSTLSRSASTKRKKSKKIGSRTQSTTKRRVGRPTGSFRRKDGSSCKLGCRCAVHGRRLHRGTRARAHLAFIDCKESMMSTGSGSTSGSSESCQSHCCSCCQHKH